MQPPALFESDPSKTKPKGKDNQPPWKDPIVGEVRKVRETFYDESGYDLYELSRRLREKQMLSGRVVVSRSSRPPRDAVKETKG